LNFKNRPIRVENLPSQNWEVLFSTARDSTPYMGQGISLSPYEVLLLKKS